MHFLFGVSVCTNHHWLIRCASALGQPVFTSPSQHFGASRGAQVEVLPQLRAMPNLLVIRPADVPLVGWAWPGWLLKGIFWHQKPWNHGEILVWWWGFKQNIAKWKFDSLKHARSEWNFNSPFWLMISSLVTVYPMYLRASSMSHQPYSHPKTGRFF